MLPGRLVADRGQGPHRQPHQQRVEVDQPDLGRRAPAAPACIRWPPAGPRAPAPSPPSCCAGGDVDAPLALVDLGVLEDVDQLQPFAEQPRSRAQEIGGRSPAGGDRAGTAPSAFHRRSPPRCSSSRAARGSNRAGARDRCRPSRHDLDHALGRPLDVARSGCRGCAPAARAGTRARTGSPAAAPDSRRGRRADRRCSARRGGAPAPGRAPPAAARSRECAAMR